MTNVWLPIFKLRQKGMKISFNEFERQYLERKANEDKRTIFKSASGNAKIVV